MAGRSRSASEGDGAAAEVSERLLFALPAPADTGVVSPPARHGDIRAGIGSQLAPPFTPAAANSLVRRIRGLSHSDPRGMVLVAAGTELDRGAAFLLVPVFLAFGVIFYFSLSTEPGFLQPVAVTSLLAVVALLARQRPRTHLCVVAALLCAAGVLAAKIETWRAQAQVLGSEISTQLTGRVVTQDAMPNGRIRLTLDVISTARPTLRYAPQRVRVSARSVPPGLVAGATVSGYVRLLPPSGPVRPDSYDFSFESYFDGIGASGFFLSNPKLASSAPAPLETRSLAAVENAREAIADHIRGSIGGPEGEIAAALVVGVRAGIPDEINEAMRRTGIYHIISISGLHMALVAGTIMAMLRGAFALFPDFSSRRPVKKYAAAAALLSIAAYLLISGVAVAAERSFIMLAVMLVAIVFDRAALTMRNLAISAIAVILVSPHEVVGPSFQMSFAATAALVGAYAGWSDYRATRISAPSPKRTLPGFLTRKFLVAMGGLATTSIVAGAATALFAIWHFQRVSPLSLFANLAVMPIVSIVVMPSAVIGALAMPFGADWPFFYIMGKGLSAMIAISAWISARSPVDAVGLVSVQSVLLVTVALVVATMATTWLRWAALPFAFAGVLTMSGVRTPDVLIAEDGRLVALPIGGGELAVSRPKPNAFSIDNWKRALDAETIIAPEVANGKAPSYDVAEAANWLPGTPFLCQHGLCVAKHPSGAIIAQADDADAAKKACGFAMLIIVDDAAASDPCRDPLVVIVTKRQLALLGSAAVYLDPNSATASAEVRFAVEQPYRPWHAQRKFSREARGLPPRKDSRSKAESQIPPASD